MNKLKEIGSNKKFIIGIGSQRAGSTLLHRILNECYTELFMHPVKELHYFDSYYKIRPREALKIFSKRQLEILERKNRNKINLNKREQCELRTNEILAEKKIEDIEYIDLYRPCLMHYRYFGEITPEYMLLNKKQIEFMKKKLNNNLYIILMIRNPIKRFISAFKLHQSYMRKKEEYQSPEKEILAS